MVFLPCPKCPKSFNKTSNFERHLLTQDIPEDQKRIKLKTEGKFVCRCTRIQWRSRQGGTCASISSSSTSTRTRSTSLRTGSPRQLSASSPPTASSRHIRGRKITNWRWCIWPRSMISKSYWRHPQPHTQADWVAPTCKEIPQREQAPVGRDISRWATSDRQWRLRWQGDRQVVIKLSFKILIMYTT